MIKKERLSFNTTCAKFLLGLFLVVCFSFGVSAADCNSSGLYADGYFVINSSELVSGCTLSSAGNYRINSTEQSTYYLNKIEVNYG